MKKHLQLLVLLILMASFSTNAIAVQTSVSFKDSPIYQMEITGDGELGIGSTLPIDYSPLSSTMSTPLGQAGNIFTIVRGLSHMVDYNKDINTVLFIHRSDPAIGFNSTSDYTFDMSTDGGNTWPTLNAGPVNNNPGLNEPNGQARYPQVTIFNPPGNTDPNNALGIYMGATHDGGGCLGGNSFWDGVSVGYPSLGAPNNLSHSNILMETYPIMECTNNALIPTSLTEGESGVFWATDWVFDGADIFELILYEGAYNPFGGTVEWTYSFMEFPHDRSFDGTATAVSTLIDFSPDGQNGWIVVTGDGGAVNCGPAPTIIPIYSRTTDGGENWTDFQAVDLQNFDGWVANLDTVTLAFEADLYVDQYGDPYIAAVVGRGADYTIFTDTPNGDLLHVSLTTFNNAADQWQMIDLGMLEVLRSDPHPTAPDYTNDQKIHVSAANDDILLVTYLDQPVDSIDRPYRDIRGIGYNIATGDKTAVKEFTLGDSAWGGNAWFYAASPHAIDQGDGSFSVPATLTDVPVDDYSSVFFHYIHDIAFGAGEFNLPADVAFHTPAPPVVGIYNSTLDGIELTLTETGSSGEVCEVVFDWGDGTSTGGLLQGDSDTHFYPNIDMVYNVCVTVINNDGFDTYCEMVSVLAVEDLEAPVITVGGVACGGTITQSVTLPFILPGATALDNIDQDVTSGIIVNNTVPVDTDGNANELGSFTIEYSVSDLAGNVGDCIITVVVVDDIGPVINLVSPAQFPVGCGEFANYVELATANDNWDGDLTADMLIDATAVNDQLNGNYTITYSVTDAAGNPAYAERTIVISGCPTGIEEAAFANFIDLYPNPTSGVINIKYDLNNSEEFNISVFNLIGELVYNSGTSTLNGADELSIDLSDKVDGIYLVRFENLDGIATKKITLSK